MNYQNYSYKDFMLDEPFQQWVLAPDSDASLFWENWLQSHPEKKAQITKAKTAILELQLAGLRKEQALIKKVPVPETAPTAEDINAIWKNIARGIQEPATEQAGNITAPGAKVIPMFSYNHWAAIAASILLIIAIGAVFWLKQKPVSKAEEITFATAFGETKRLTLPDHSTILLNANSRVTTARHWPADADREVTLAGEAFFSVVHTKNHRRFKVTLSKGARIEVLGTEFAVTDRPTLSRVVLNKGRVKVAVVREQNGLSGDNHPIAAIMAPGDLVEIDRLHGKLSKTKIADPEYYSAFTKNLIEFNNSPLSEVARVLQDNYGYKVTFLPASLADKRFTSSNPGNRIDLLLFAIEKSFDLKVIQKGRHITIKQNKLR